MHTKNIPEASVYTDDSLESHFDLVNLSLSQDQAFRKISAGFLDTIEKLTESLPCDSVAIAVVANIASIHSEFNDQIRNA